MNRRRFLKASLAAAGAAAGMAATVTAAAEEPVERTVPQKDPIMPAPNSATRAAVVAGERYLGKARVK